MSINRRSVSRRSNPKEFKVNYYLSLKLEDNITNIYIKGILFRQCKYLLLNIPINEITSLEDIESIDEAAEKLDRSLEGSSKNFIIPPETEFWGHCSNLHVWYEYNYDTRILHRNLAFPLLKKLVEAGDPIAKEVFREEIINRYIEGNETVRTYLIEYFQYLERHEIELLLEDFDPTFIREQEVQGSFYSEPYEQLTILAKLGHSKANQILKEEFLERFEKDQIEGVIFLGKHLKHLKKAELEILLNDLDYDIIIDQDPSSTFNILRSLLELRISRVRKIYRNLYGSRSLVNFFSSIDTSKQPLIYESQLKLVQDIIPPLEYAFLQELQSLIDEKIQVYIDPSIMSSPSIVIEQSGISQIRLERQNLEEIPISIGNLRFLRTLNLNFNRLKEVPEVIGENQFLHELFLINNSITRLPRTIGMLTHLRYLDLTRNKLDSLPPSMANLQKLLYLNFNFNILHLIPEFIGGLESLLYLFLDYNRLQYLPNIFHKLKNLRRIDLQGNRLKTVPEALLNLNSLKMISLSKEYLDRETNSLLESMRKKYKYVNEADKKHFIWGAIREKFEDEPLNILFEKYILRFFYGGGGFTNIFWSDNDEAKVKYGYPARLYQLPLSSDIIEKFESLYKKWYKFIGKHESTALEEIYEYKKFKNDTINVFLQAKRQLGPNFHVKFHMRGYRLPYER